MADLLPCLVPGCNEPRTVLAALCTTHLRSAYSYERAWIEAIEHELLLTAVRLMPLPLVDALREWHDRAGCEASSEGCECCLDKLLDEL